MRIYMTKMTGKKNETFMTKMTIDQLYLVQFVFFFKLIFFGLKFYFLFVNKSYGQTNGDKSMNLQNQTDKNKT